MHAYVFWRLGSVPWVAAHVSGRLLVLGAVLFWASYPLARIIESTSAGPAFYPLSFAAANWIGVLFLLFAAFLAVDVVTLGGWLIGAWAPRVRTWTALGAGMLSAVALFQGLRPPVVREYEIRLPDLPPERDGLRLAHLSDLHLGSLLGERWLRGVIARVDALRPDAVLVVGDIVDGDVRHVESLRPVLATLQAPLGVWAVTGNHEYYAGADRCARLFEEAGFRVLRDSWREISPGLVLAGVDDLTARQQMRMSGGVPTSALNRALTNRPPGATLLLSHSPLQADEAAAKGVGLMLCGHTHNGQIWPFKYLVASRYSLLGGRYDVKGMSVIVCRGTGTWGPRMRLWRPGEIVSIRLRR
jgi:predicted MPP superfamily phosphohydrolase